MSALLEIDRLGKAFGATRVLAEISLHVAKGEFVSILAPSGAGKSTLFKLLIGEHAPDTGQIAMAGTPLAGQTRRFAYMPQHDALMPWRRIMDNLTLGLEVQGVRRAEARAQVVPLLEEFGLAGFERHYPAHLSGGMRQRAALLRTVVQHRDILLLDEPFGALDALTRTRMQAWLEALWQRHAWTALLITHDIHEAVRLSDRIYVLSERPARVLDEIAVPLPRPRTGNREAAHAAQPIVDAILEQLLTLTAQKEDRR